MKRLSILLLFLLLASYTNAQKNIYRQWNYELTPFIGTWIAEKDDMQYEITLDKENFNLDIGHLNYFFWKGSELGKIYMKSLSILS